MFLYLCEHLLNKLKLLETFCIIAYLQLTPQHDILDS